MVANSDSIKQIKHKIVEMKHVEKPVEACNDENNVNLNETGIREVIEKQEAIDEKILTNSDEVKRLDSKIKMILKDNAKKD